MTKTIKKGTALAVPLNKDIVPEENTMVKFDAEALIAKAIDQKVPVETMERLLAIRKEMKAEWAKEQYYKAMAKFQSECPTIVKTKEVKTKSGLVAYKYAPIESIVEQVKPYLQSNGFSYSTSMEVLPAGVKVICKVVHVDGHTEGSEMEVPLGNKTDIMSASQVTAAASTFAKRYAFCNAFGILTGDEDNDAREVNEPTTSDNTRPAPSTFPPSKAQLEIIGKVMHEKGITKEDIIDAGFASEAMKLTGGMNGTASELIQWLFDAKPRIVNGQEISREELPR